MNNFCIITRSKGGGGGIVPYPTSKINTLEDAIKIGRYFVDKDGYFIIFKNNKKIYFEGNQAEYKLNN